MAGGAGRPQEGSGSWWRYVNADESVESGDAFWGS
jgi:hypothetical protein